METRQMRQMNALDYLLTCVPVCVCLLRERKATEKRRTMVRINKRIQKVRLMATAAPGTVRMNINYVKGPLREQQVHASSRKHKQPSPAPTLTTPLSFPRFSTSLHGRTGHFKLEKDVRSHEYTLQGFLRPE